MTGTCCDVSFEVILHLLLIFFIQRRSTRYDDVSKLTSGFTTGNVPLQKPSTTNAMSSENKVNSMRDTFIASSKARYNRNKMFDFHQVRI